MTLPDLLAWLAERSQRHALIIMLAAALLAAVSAITTARHLGINTNTNLMFPESLAWRHNAIAFARDFPQFSDLLVAVVDGRIPEDAEATAADLATALALDHTDFKTVRRPDSSPFLSQEGLLFLDTPRLEAVLDRIIDAQPFLGELATDQSARGLFAALSLLGRGATQDQAALDSFRPALTAFHRTMAEAIDGHGQPLSWSQLLGGQLAELAGRYKFVLVQPTLDFSALEPGGAAAQRMREIIQATAACQIRRRAGADHRRRGTGRR